MAVCQDKGATGVALKYRAKKKESFLQIRVAQLAQYRSTIAQHTQQSVVQQFNCIKYDSTTINSYDSSVEHHSSSSSSSVGK